jgi:DNA-binding NarL/FixJ family response regulator
MPIARTIRVLAIDDHPLLRAGIASVINAEPGMEIVAEAADADEAIAAYRKHRPDITLMDLRLSKGTGIEAIIAIRSSAPGARIIVLTTFGGDVLALQAFKAGASGYLLKSMMRTELIDTIRLVHAGQRNMQGKILSRFENWTCCTQLPPVSPTRSSLTISISLCIPSRGTSRAFFPNSKLVIVPMPWSSRSNAEYLNSEFLMWMTKMIAKLTSTLIIWCPMAAVMPLLTGCTRSASIVFLEVPPASAGGIGTSGLIRGKVMGRHRGRHIVLYAFADSRWWVQPFESLAHTEIAADGSWKAQIHLGTEYAAVLSKEDSLPSQFLDALPTVGKTIDAIAVVKGGGIEMPTPEDPSRGTTLHFSGLQWKVRTIPGDQGSKTNEYSSNNVYVDDSGALHLRLRRSSRGWVCSEVQSMRSFGYGTYSLNISDVAQLESAVMFSAFTYFDKPLDGDHRELAIRLTRRGVASNTNAEFSIQPSFVPANFYHFNVPAGPLRLDMNWHHDEGEFVVSRDEMPVREPFVSWPFNANTGRHACLHESL